MLNRHLTTVLAALALIVLAVPAAARKERDWQTGKVLDPQNSAYNRPSTVDAPYGNSDVPIVKVYEPFLIEGPTSAYFARQGLRWEWSKPAELKLNGTVKFAVAGDRLYVIDEAGKERRMQITKTVPRKTDQE